MTKTIFYAWQSDLSETRSVLRAALKKGLRDLNRDLAVEEALRADEATPSGSIPMSAPAQQGEQL